MVRGETQLVRVMEQVNGGLCGYICRFCRFCRFGRFCRFRSFLSFRSLPFPLPVVSVVCRSVACRFRSNCHCRFRCLSFRCLSFRSSSIRRSSSLMCLLAATSDTCSSSLAWPVDDETRVSGPMFPRICWLLSSSFALAPPRHLEWRDQAYCRGLAYSELIPPAGR